MGNDHNLFLIRSLNYSKRYHLPSYMAMRLFALSVVSDKNSAWLERYIYRKTDLRKKSRYIPFKSLKKVNPDNTTECRSFSLASPVVAMSEAWLLNELSKCPDFQVKDCVYSYLWPTKNSGNCFKFFVQGYNDRNEDISTALKSLPDSGFLITDIRNFYPSIPRSMLFSRLEEKLSSSDLTKEIKQIVLDLAKASLPSDVSETGIAIGPTISHLLANVYMEDFDRQMLERCPGKYFRYVDDIVIVDKVDKLPDHQKFISHLMEQHGLKIHDGKTEILRDTDWHNHFPKYPKSGNSFNELQRDLQIFFMLYPGKFDKVKSRFAEQGISLPLNRYIADSRYRRFRRYILREFSAILKNIFVTESDLVKSAISLRETLFEELKTICEELKGLSPTKYRWQIKRLRHRVNPLIYLFPLQEYSKIIELLAKVPEFYDTIALLQSLIRKDPGKLLHMPGAPVRTFAEIALELGFRKSKYPHPLVSDTHVDSVCVLLLNDLIELDASNYKSGKHTELLSFCSMQPPAKIESNDFTYINEVRCLQLNASKKLMESIMRTRFDSNEDSILSALMLGDNYYY